MAGIFEIITKNMAKLEAFDEVWAEEFTRRVKDKTPVRTGNLRDGWDYEVNEDEFAVFNDVEYAEYVENGVPPHTRDSAWGRPTNPYTHPGQRGAHMLDRTLLEIDQITNVAVNKVQK